MLSAPHAAVLVLFSCALSSVPADSVVGVGPDPPESRTASTSSRVSMAAETGTRAETEPAAAQVPATASTRRPLRLEDYYRLKSVGSPRISPDGRRVAYTVNTPVEETNGTRTETWVVPADGSAPPTRLQHEGKDVSDPRWQDDGRLRVTEGKTAWLFDLDRPQVPAERDDRKAPDGVLSPDGRLLATVRDVSVTPPAPPVLTDFERRHDERFKGHQLDWYPFLQDGQPFPASNPRARPASEITLESTDGSGTPRQLTRLGLRPSSPKWTPDGRALVFAADESVHDELAYSRTDLFLVTVEGELKRLTDDGFVYSNHAVSPDGRWISYVRSFGLDMIIDGKLDHGGPQDLYIMPVAGGDPINLTGDWDLDPGTPMWSPDSRHVYFTAGIGGAVHLFRVAAAGRRVEQVTAGDRRISSLDIDAAFRRMTYTVGEFDRPSDVWVADLDGRNERRLTDLHGELLAEVEIATRPSERVSWESYDGTRIEGFLLFPHGYDRASGPYPLIVVNHGGPHAASGYGFDFKLRLFTAHGYFVFLPNFRSSTGYGTAFKWGTWGAWGSNDGEDVLSGVDHLIANYPIDRNRVGSTGHSYGGILTNWLITRYPDRFRAAVSGAGESNWTSNYAMSDMARTKETEFFGRPWEPRAREIMIRQSAYLNSGGVRAATLFVHGEVDYRVPLSGAIQLYTSLKKQRVPAKLLIYEGQPHGIRGHWNNVHRAMHELRWWETYLKPRLSVTNDEPQD
jgi:dipeptidyl aminopeptidase/acylaminoacyl peptidase